MGVICAKHNLLPLIKIPFLKCSTMHFYGLTYIKAWGKILHMLLGVDFTILQRVQFFRQATCSINAAFSFFGNLLICASVFNASESVEQLFK